MSKSILIISSYTVSKFRRFFETQCRRKNRVAFLGNSVFTAMANLTNKCHRACTIYYKPLVSSNCHFYMFSELEGVGIGTEQHSLWKKKDHQGRFCIGPLCTVLLRCVCCLVLECWSCCRLCLSISDFHPDTWNPAWSVSTILTGLLSFMVTVFSNMLESVHFCHSSTLVPLEPDIWCVHLISISNEHVQNIIQPDLFAVVKTTILTRRHSESAYIRQVHDNAMMYTFTYAPP